MGDQLPKQRKSSRSSFTKTANELKVLVDVDPVDRARVQVLFSRLTRVHEELQGYDQLSLQIILDNNCSQQEYDKEKEDIERYNDDWTEVNLLVDALNSKSRPVSPTSSIHSSRLGETRRQIKLPKIELKKFDGDRKHWLGFWDQFKKIHEDVTIEASHKFQYLIQSLVEGTRPYEVVSGIPQTEENYQDAVNALKTRYGEKEVLIDVYVRELLKVVFQNARERVPLIRVYDQLESQLRILESLGVNSENNVILFPLVESSFSQEILKTWTRSPYSRVKSNPQKTRLSLFMNFLKEEVEGDEEVTEALAHSLSLSEQKSKDVRGQGKREDTKKREKPFEMPTAAGLFQGQESKPSCIFCERRHVSQDCGKASGMSLTQKEDMIKEKKVCFVCFKNGHVTKTCRAFVKCHLCSKKHHVIMCPELPINKKTQERPKREIQSTVASNLSCTSSVLLQTVLVRVLGNGTEKVVRVLFDNGAQRSYIREITAESLKILPIGHETMRKSLFGGTNTELQRHQKYRVSCQSLDGQSLRTLELLDEPVLCGTIPKIMNGPWMKEVKKRKIQLSDLQSEPVDIDILIGSDYWGLLMTGRVIKLRSGLISMETVFGWTLSGLINPKESMAMNTVTSLFTESVSVSDLWSLEAIGITDPIEALSKSEKDEIVSRHFEETVERTPEGRYSVSLPWTNGRQDIPSNRSIAEKRLNSLTTKLIQNGKYQNYDSILKAWEEEGFIEKCNEAFSFGHFLPHRVVLKPESVTTPLRPVFDASCKSGRNPSLNECLEKGPNLLELIPSILLRFREKKIGVTSDIRKAFQMIEVTPEDRKFLKFLWWEDERRKMIVYQHNRMVFGVNCSPFLLQAVLKFHFSRVREEDRQISQKLLSALYVDNCVTSVDTVGEYMEFRNRATELLREAKMDLRQWEATGDTSGVGQPISGGCGLGVGGSFTHGTHVLGLLWDKKADVLTLDFKNEEQNGPLTKRKVLSYVQRIFDPIGFSCPVTLQPKILLQRIWSYKIGWDEPVPEEFQAQFQKWSQELQHLLEVRIPRHIMTSTEQDGIQIHTFGDSSQAAYASVVFIRNKENGKVTVQLAQAKARVSPLKKGTIPRLELLACLIGARLAKSVREALHLEKAKSFYWSDSTTALAWIRRNDNWGTFVGNRVKEIIQLTDGGEWKHVAGVLNPADLPSRGCSPREFLDSRWWEGPEWLRHSPENWPSFQEDVDEEEVCHEKRKTVTAMVSATVKPWYLPKFSLFNRNVRVIAWIRRFMRNSKLKNEERNFSGFLNVPELVKAEVDIFKIIQNESFGKESKQVNGVPVILKEDGLLHVKSKLLNKEDTVFFRWPILLSSNHVLVDQLVMELHRTYGHIGIQCLLGKLREKFWVLRGRKTVMRVIRSCVVCRRQEAKGLEVNEVPLPEKRVTISRSFDTTGIDLAGPLYLKDGSKSWIVLFTCAVFRCVELDLVNSLSTEAFLGALERFINRFGRPTTIYSDNGTNFQGTENFFKSLDWNRIQKEAEVKKICWIFNPPTAAWWGGWWERLIRSVKALLKRMLGRAKLSEDKLRTCLTSVTSSINSRPLTTITEDLEDLIPLTPAMFLRGPVVTKFPEGNEQKAEQFQDGLRRSAILRRELEGRFRKEYLALLVQRAKERRNPAPKVGDIVLVGADNRKRIDWPLGRILELIPGIDGEFRVARVKTAMGCLIRPLQRLFPLEISQPLDSQLTRLPTVGNPVQDAAHGPDHVQVRTRFGRLVKKPKHLL